MKIDDLIYALNKFETAFARLEQATGRVVDDLDRDGVIQRFEFTFELLWKTVKIFLEYEGFRCVSPRSCIKEGARREILLEVDARFRAGAAATAARPACGRAVGLSRLAEPEANVRLTLRENTERPVTVTQGTNRIVGNDPQRIVSEALAVLDGAGRAGRTLELWDGRAAERIVAVLHSGGRRRGTNER